MPKNRQKWKTHAFLMALSLAFTHSAWAARQVNLVDRPINYLRTFNQASGLTGAPNATSLEKVRETVDFNDTQHVRLQQKYYGHTVWGGEAIVHVPKNKQTLKNTSALVAVAEKSNATMNGKVYEDLQADLQNTPVEMFAAGRPQQALQQVLASYQREVKYTVQPKATESRLIVFVDEEHRAHWAFYVSFYLNDGKSVISQPTFIVDGYTFKPYRKWNEVRSLVNVKAGGFGGNPRMGKLIYDGKEKHFPLLDISRNPRQRLCYLINKDVSVTDFRTHELVNFRCTDQLQGNSYWNGNFDESNQGYSPSNDALYAGKVVKGMYEQWYQLPVLINEDGTPMKLELITHSPNFNDEMQPDPDNALWLPAEQKMYFGDGLELFYPLTSIGIAGHEISHGFTHQHSGLINYGESGAIDESFSDMAAQAVEYFATNKNSWQIAGEVTKRDGFALRYMDEPTTDCIKKIRQDEGCSIDHVKGKRFGMNTHYASGIFNKAFYILANTRNWDVQKAFNIMVKANRDYWHANIEFNDAACGVLNAAADYRKLFPKDYAAEAVIAAFDKVGIDLKPCEAKLKNRFL